MSTGYDAVAADADLLCLGEMGIGNTTAAAAIAAALFGGAGDDWVGRGTGVDDAGLARKAAAVDAAARAPRRRARRSACASPRASAAASWRRSSAPRSPPASTASRCCSTASSSPPPPRRSPSSTRAALAHALAAHVSAEAGHRRLLDRLGLKPLLDLGMRLGEASGACLAVNIVRSALACHAGMASFAEAGVSEK